MEIRPLSYYAKEVRRELPDDIFLPAPSRLLWLALHTAIIAAGIWLIATDAGGWWLNALLVIPLGLAYGGMAFVGHETMHGATTRHPLLRKLLGAYAFLPFLLSQRHWVAWHNRMHHGHTMHAGVDPDAFPTLAHYQGHLRARVIDHVSFGGGRLAGVLTLMLGFIGQNLGVLLGAGPRARYLPRGQYLLALLETALALGFWVALGALLGVEVFVFGWLLPFYVANAVVMAYILTNHSLSPLTEVNDPLLNSLSVSVPTWYERITLQFGLHVEHHLFPSVSGRHAWRIRDRLAARWPDRYRNLPLSTALGRLWSSGRIYKDAVTLVDPTSGVESPTLGQEEVRVRRDHRPQAIVLPS